MSHSYRISVIIPVYNVEAYLAKCLDSVLSQSDETIEIICVNDSSPDNSRQIIAGYMTKYPAIKCIDRPNGGLSAARNSGIKEAKGEYIVLLDSDDWLEPDVLGDLYRQAKDEDLDVLIGNTKWIYSDGITHVEKQNSAEIITTVVKGEDAIVSLMKSGIYVPMAYNYICKRDYIIEKKLYFKEGLLYEDELWTPQILINAMRVSSTHSLHYNYLQRPNTITNSGISQHKIDSFFYVSEKLLSLIDFSTNKALKECLWIRACLVYGKGEKMNELLKSSKKQHFVISKLNLLKSGLPVSGFNSCLGYMNYTKNQRRSMRLLKKLFF